MMPLGHIGIPLLLPLLKRDMEIDVRLLMIGSILPDLIDKPMGHILFPQDNGRIFAHTLLFVIILSAVGLMYRPVLSLSLGATFHHILDGMFLDPRTSLWPLLGPFESYDFRVYQWIEAYRDPYVITEEIAGALLLIILILNWKLFIPSNLKSFLRRGFEPSLQKDIYKKDME